jgi:single-stranded-DNA-specific exonuclease
MFATIVPARAIAARFAPIACGDDGKSFKFIAFRSAAGELGQALLSSASDRRWWLAGTIKRDEWNGGNAAEMHVEDAALA